MLRIHVSGPCSNHDVGTRARYSHTLIVGTSVRNVALPVGVAAEEPPKIRMESIRIVKWFGVVVMQCAWLNPSGTFRRAAVSSG